MVFEVGFLVGAPYSLSRARAGVGARALSWVSVVTPSALVGKGFSNLCGCVWGFVVGLLVVDFLHQSRRLCRMLSGMVGFAVMGRAMFSFWLLLCSLSFRSYFHPSSLSIFLSCPFFL